ncbi:unnamed protein product [Prunus armeniaca]
MAVSDQLLKVPFPSIAVVSVMTVLPMECVVFTGVPPRKGLSLGVAIFSPTACLSLVSGSGGLG